MEIFIKGQDDILIKLPVNPEEIEVNENQKIEIIEVLNAGEIPIPGFKELQTLTFSSFFPTIVDGNYTKQAVDAVTYINKLRSWKEQNKPVRLVITGLFGKVLQGGNVNQLYLITDFKTSSKFGYDSDVLYDIKLVEYKQSRPRQIEVKKPTPVNPVPKPVVTPKPTPRPPTTPPKPKPRTHTVVRGDCLWIIARKYYGDGSKWPTIYNANKGKIKNPHWIYPGQVFTIP